MICILFLVVLCLGDLGVAYADYYVSPGGSDANPGTATQPFATLARARDAVRAVNKAMTSDITIYLRGGTYQLPDTLVLDQTDSGTNGHNVVYKAYSGERPIISGGQKITGWVAVGNGTYKAAVGGLRFRQLYVNGVRAIRARTPDVGNYHQLIAWDKGGKRLEIAASAISNWGRLNEVEMVILGKGVNQANLRISSFAVVGINAFVVPREPERTRMFQQVYPPKEPRPYFFENAAEFLNQPGEWYLNIETNELFYYPQAGGEYGDSRRGCCPTRTTHQDSGDPLFSRKPGAILRADL